MGIWREANIPEKETAIQTLHTKTFGAQVQLTTYTTPIQTREQRKYAQTKADGWRLVF
jgi:hypothetical protein